MGRFLYHAAEQSQLVEGHGLVFNPGEKLHTFTSPLGVLLPALGLWAGGGNDIAALWFFRLVSAGGLAGALGLLWNRLNTLGLGWTAKAFLLGFILLDAKLIEFTIDGQESALLVAFTLLLWTELERPAGARAIILGIAYSGLMWTRPDAFILAGALTTPHLLFGNRSTARDSHFAIIKGVVIGAALYAPWFIWAWYYYGSPIPHTVIAKGAVTRPPTLLALAETPFRILKDYTECDLLFLPTNFNFGGWPPALRGLAHVLIVVVGFAWLAPGMTSAARRVSFTVFVGLLYLCSIIVFAWYLPQWTVLGAIVLMFLLDRMHQWWPVNRLWYLAGAVRVAGLALVVFQGCISAASAVQMYYQQRWVEEDGRKSIGQWLAAHANPADTVFLEPLGYIGYFSNLKTYDFPGLSSTEVTTLVKSGKIRYRNLISQLHPRWLVLRSSEIKNQRLGTIEQIPGYTRVRMWDATEKLNGISFLPGRGWLEFDSQFILFRRDSASPHKLE